jgi:peptidoglycan/xylan/chitin deacetylase (PgdA/CDA1 family)
MSIQVPGTVAITYDDGPYIYTTYILDLLKQYNAKATFFITGNNLGKGEIDNAAYPWASIIKRMFSDGHQIASHTWSHQDLSALTTQQRQHQMYANEMALRNILGFFPTYMRPPYSSCTEACQADMARMGYHVTYFDLDTEDYLNDSPTMIQKPKNNFLGNISSRAPTDSDWLVIGHDIHEQTAHNLTAFMLQNLQQKGYKAVTVGECLGDPQANWYRSSTGSPFTSSVRPPVGSPTTPSSVPTAAPSTPAGLPGKVSIDSSCGGQARYTCLGSRFGNCCSRNGYWWVLL